MTDDIISKMAEEVSGKMNLGKTGIASKTWGKIVGFAAEKCLSLWESEVVQSHASTVVEQQLMRIAEKFEGSLWEMVLNIISQMQPDLAAKMRNNNLWRAGIMFFTGFLLSKISIALADYFNDKGDKITALTCMKIHRVTSYMSTNTLVEQFGIHVWIKKVVDFTGSMMGNLKDIDASLPASK